ncbi:predicted protein [Aspergillus terreus NIH2624]|uniref:Uncharacterized protein n=1 Tax=Aspergillus terreus (strain NIH 2624 / FGSC A1156) TaxID=341663 RepID=Q0CFS9_ASPTN|nr:uncharacterized protein ATEG_07455 [Aspergillus terreus NIH2624]EAU31717.1 predicted protein [Aspergillus terreus NIH2624]
MPNQDTQKGPFTYSPVINEDDDSSRDATKNVYKQERGGSPRLWTPFFLRRPVMLSFLLLFVAILCSLVALYTYTQREHRSLGIETDGSRYYYLWTYGPTAVFMLLTAGWTQVEYRASQSMPWVLMLRGPTPASESIFLDYLSNWNVVSLYKSLRRGHYLVALCVTGSLLLNGLTVFSTGLFELDTVRVTQVADLTVTHKFDGAQFDPVVNDGKAYTACLGYTKNVIDPPIGLHDPYVYPPFRSAKHTAADNDTMIANAEYEAELEIFTPTIQCQEATTTIAPSHARFDPQDNSEVYEADGCRVAPTGIPLALMRGDKFGMDADVAGCQGQTLSNDGKHPPEVDWNVDWRLWVSIAQTMSQHSNNYSTDGWETHEVRGVMCKMHYNMSRAPVRIWREPGQSAILSSINASDLTAIEPIANVSDGKLLYAAHQSIGAAIDYSSDTGSEYVFAAGDSLEKLWNSSAALAAAVEKSYSCIARQLAKDSLLVQEPHSVQGTERTTDQRLFVRELSFSLMVALLGLLIIVVCLLLVFFIPVAVCPRDTGCIGGLATVFAQSPDFMSKFRGSALMTTTQMAGSPLGQAQYTSSVTNTGSYTIMSDNSSPNAGLAETTPHWWRPLSTSWSIWIPLVAAPLTVIIALEVVYHISTSSRGITLVEGKSSYIHYIWVYIPALIMFAIRCLFQTVEFGARVFQPYLLLRRGAAAADKTILENQLRKVAIYGVFDSLRKRQWALAAATIALLLAAITPIVVSGLYMVQASAPTSPRNLTRIDRWNLGDPNPGSAAGSKYYDELQPVDAKIPGMIMYLNLSYPQWTYKDLAFPQVRLADADGAQEQGYIEARLPALRGRLDCAEVKSPNCSYQDDYAPYILTCDDVECSGSVFTSVGRTNAVEYFSAGSVGSSNYDPGKNCPDNRLLFGKWFPGETPMQKLVVSCDARIEEVDVDVRLQVPSFTLDPDFEPRVIEGSAKEDIRTNRSSFPGFDSMKEFLFTPETYPDGQFPETNNQLIDVDVLMRAAIYGVDGVPAEELLNADKLISRVNEVWGIIMAQLYNSGGRQPFDQPFNHSWSVLPLDDAVPTYSAVFYDGRKYLVQSEVSTRILDGLLATMVVCGVVSIALLQTKEVLPKNPCSIGAVASLLHGSRLLGPDVIPKGAEWCSDYELKRRGIFQGQKFTMGWWTDRKIGGYNPVSYTSNEGDLHPSGGMGSASGDDISVSDIDRDDSRVNERTGIPLEVQSSLVPSDEEGNSKAHEIRYRH